MDVARLADKAQHEGEVSYCPADGCDGIGLHTTVGPKQGHVRREAGRHHESRAPHLGLDFLLEAEQRLNTIGTAQNQGILCVAMREALAPLKAQGEARVANVCAQHLGAQDSVPERPVRITQRRKCHMQAVICNRSPTQMMGSAQCPAQSGDRGTNWLRWKHSKEQADEKMAQSDEYITRTARPSQRDQMRANCLEFR